MKRKSTVYAAKPHRDGQASAMTFDNTPLYEWAMFESNVGGSNGKGDPGLPQNAFKTAPGRPNKPPRRDIGAFWEATWGRQVGTKIAS